MASLNSLNSYAAITSDFKCKTNAGESVYFEVTPENNIYHGVISVRVGDLVSKFEPEFVEADFTSPNIKASDAKNSIEIKDATKIQDGVEAIFRAIMDLKSESLETDGAEVECTRVGEA